MPGLEVSMLASSASSPCTAGQSSRFSRHCRDCSCLSPLSVPPSALSCRLSLSQVTNLVNLLRMCPSCSSVRVPLTSMSRVYPGVPSLMCRSSHAPSVAASMRCSVHDTLRSSLVVEHNDLHPFSAGLSMWEEWECGHEVVELRLVYSWVYRCCQPQHSPRCTACSRSCCRCCS